jgi:hypothetical protein
MTIRKINLNDREYQFVNESRSTRNGFAHDTVLFVDGYQIGKATCHYINRTWECYQYQTVMQRCISDIIEANEQDYIAVYKADNGIKRLTADKKDNIIREFYNQDNIKELLELKKQLEQNG